MEFKAGDKVRRIKEFNYWENYGFKREGIYTIAKLDCDGDPMFRDHRGEMVDGWDSSNFELVTEPEFTRGERVDVGGKTRIYVATIDGAFKPYICVDRGSEKQFEEGKSFGIGTWSEIKKLPKKNTITLTTGEALGIIKQKLRIDDNVVIQIEE